MELRFNKTRLKLKAKISYSKKSKIDSSKFNFRSLFKESQDPDLSFVTDKTSSNV